MSSSSLVPPRDASTANAAGAAGYEEQVIMSSSSSSLIVLPPRDSSTIAPPETTTGGDQVVMSPSSLVLPPRDASTVAPPESSSTGGTSNISRVVSDRSTISDAHPKNERHGIMDLHSGNEFGGRLFCEMDLTAQIGMIHNDEIKTTAGTCGIIWRKFFRWILVVTADRQNALRFTRALQVQLDYLSPHEAFLLGDVIKALDAVQNSTSSEKAKAKAKAKAQLNDTLREALKNRNVGRELFQS